MRFSILIIFFLFLFTRLTGQALSNGAYKFKVAFDEWEGKSLGASCMVKIKGDSIVVINNGTLSGKKGEIIESGILRKHLKTGKWIITHHHSDVYAKAIGECSGGPMVIDLKNKIVWLC